MFKIGFLLFGMGPKTKIETRLLLFKKPVEHCKWSLLMPSCIVTTAEDSVLRTEMGRCDQVQSEG
jgi:hypothetical protein